MSEREREFGQTLARLREEKGLSIEQMASAIKVRGVFLRALEEGRFEGLPPAIFLEGFVKAYALQVGAAPEPLIARLRGLTAARRQNEAASQPHPPEARSSRRPWWRAIVWLGLLAAVLAAIYVALGRFEGGGLEGAGEQPSTGRRIRAPKRAPAGAPIAEKTAPAPPSVPPMEEAGAPAEPAPEPGPSGQTAPAPVAPAAVVGTPKEPVSAVRAGEGDLVLAADGACWCEIWADGTRVVYRQVAAGERLGLKGARFSVTLGNAGAIRLTFKGAPVSLPSGKGAVVKGLELSDPKGAVVP